MMIEANNLSKVFATYKALEDLSFKVPKGAYVVVIGPNGAGKSILMKMLMGVVTPDMGRILIDGRIPQQVKREDVGYVPQIKSINRRFPALAEELVLSGQLGYWPLFMRAKQRQWAIETLREVGAGHLAGKSVATLSGGELQRVLLVRALAKKPKLLILDEPATGIDAVGEKDMYQMLETSRERHAATIIMVSHDLEAARHHASHVLLLNRRLMAFGAPKEVLVTKHLDLAFGHVHHAHTHPNTHAPAHAPTHVHAHAHVQTHPSEDRT